MSSCHVRPSPWSSCAKTGSPSLHNARATTVNAYRYSLAPLQEEHGGAWACRSSPAPIWTSADRAPRWGHVTAKGHARQAWSPRSLNKAVDCRRALLDYGVERRELSRNVAAACGRFRASAERWRPTHPRKSRSCCAPPTRTATGTSGVGAVRPAARRDRRADVVGCRS